MIDYSPIRGLVSVVLGFALAFCTNAQTLSPQSAEYDVARDWKNVLEHGDLEKLMDTYDLVDQLSNEEGVIQAELCTQHKLALDQALITNPVGLALWYAAYQCADALQDAVNSESRLAQFEALLRYGFEQSPDDSGRPIRVVTEADVWAFVEASGQELLHTFYDPLQDRRYLLLVVSLWDEETKRERILTFDFLDTLVKLSRSEPDAQYPAFRVMLSESILAHAKDNPESAGAFAHELLVSIRTPSVSGRIDALESLAKRGSVYSAILLLAACEGAPKADCGARSVDALLPFAEMRIASAMIALAGAYGRGIVVPRDPKAAKSLLDAADARLGDFKGRTTFALYSILQSGFELTWPIVRKDMERAAESGGPTAVAFLTALHRDEQSGRPLPKRLASQLLLAAQNGFPQAQYMQGLEMIDAGASGEGFAWVERAAINGLATAQSKLGFSLLQGKGIPKDEERALHWLAAAGQSGNTNAMLEMARHYGRSKNSRVNRSHLEGWLRSASAYGDKNASMALAALYESEQEGLLGNATNAVAIYRELLAMPDFAGKPEAAEARQRLALMLTTGRGGKIDRLEAEQLLLPDAEQGVSKSQLALAMHYFRSGNTSDHTLGKEWLEKSVAAKNPDAVDYQAFALWYGYRLPIDKKKAASLFEELVDAEYPSARNNLAWVMCTAQEAKDRDAKRGLAILDKLDRASMGWGVLDTLAACQAADGAFDEAVTTQQGVVDAAKKSGGSAKTVAKLQTRLDNYQNKQITVELMSPMFESVLEEDDEVE